MSRARTPGYFAGLTRNTVFLAAASLFADISSEMLYPVLPVFLTQTLHACGSMIGLIEGLADGTQNIVQGLAGSLSDRLRNRKFLALVGYAIAAASKPLIGLSSVWQGVLAARFSDRLGTGIRSAPRDALVASSIDDAHRGKAFGLEGLGDNAGAFLGPVIAVLLISAWRVDLRLLFFLAVVPGALAFFMVLLVRERPTARKPAARFEAGLGRFPKPYGRYLFATLVFGLGNSSNAFLILQMKALGVTLAQTMLIYAGFNLVAALVSYPAGALSDWIGRRNLLAFSIGVFIVSYLGFAAVRREPLVAGLFVIYGVSQGVFRTVGKGLASDFSPEPLRASGIGWYGATVGLSGLAASLVAGVLWDHVGHAAVFLYGAVLAGAGMAALLALVPPRPASHSRFTP